MLYQGARLNKWIHTPLAVISVFLLASSISAFYGFYKVLFLVVAPIHFEGGGNAALIAGVVSELLIRQAAIGIICVLGLILSSVLVFRLKYNQNWFKVTIKGLAVVMLLTFPFLFLLGVYAFYLSVKIRENA